MHASQSQRGSAIILAMIMCAIIGISLASYINLGRSSLTVSNRALYNNAAMNVAENGLEEAMYSINKMVEDPAYDWAADGWTIDGTAAYRKWDSTTDPFLKFDQNATGELRVYVFNYQGISAPKVVARSTINLGGAASAPIEKWVEVTLSKASKFANGLVAKESILFRGNNPKVDSWNSDPDNDGSYEAYNAATNRNDKGSVGSISVSVDAVLVKNADVWGYVATGGDDPADGVGNNGSILGEDSPGGVKVDPDRVSTDFAANFDPVTTPATTPSLGSLGEGIYGTNGVTQTLTCTDITVSGNSKMVEFRGNVTLIITAGAGSQAIKIAGNGSGIKVAAGGTLTIYTAGNVDLTGQGITNTDGAPKNVQFYGTDTTGVQDIKIAGGGTYSGVIYAPNASVQISGDGHMWGSVVANKIDLTGNADFHYDESLANMGGGNPFRVAKWNELNSQASRNDYADELDF